MPDDEEFRPGAHDLETPFIFVPHGAPDPVEWKRQHPGWVSFPATFVPHPRPIPKWKVINGQRWPLDKKGRPWPKTRYGRPTCPFDELPPGMPAPGTQYELMRKLENPTLFWEGEPTPTVEEFSLLAAKLRAERAVAAPPPVEPPKAYDGDGLGPARDYLNAMKVVDQQLREFAAAARQREAARLQQQQTADAIPALSNADSQGGLAAISPQSSGGPEPLTPPEPEARAAPPPTGIVLSDADPDPVLEGRQYAAAPLALAPTLVPAVRLVAPYVARGLGALLGTGAGVVLNEVAKPSGEEETKPTAVEGTEATPQRATVSPDKRIHILAGDENGGGHRPGTGIPGKTEFPVDWSDDKIIGAIEDIANDPKANRKGRRDGRTVIDATGDGVDIRVVVAKDKTSIVTSHPINLPRNPRTGIR